MMRFKRFRWLGLILFASPLLLVWGLRKVASERPHFVGSESLPVGKFFFPEGGGTACTRSDYLEYLSCWNRETGKKVSKPSMPEHRYGRLLVDYGDNDGTVHYSLDGEINDSPRSRSLAFAALSSDKRFLTLASRTEQSRVMRWDLETGQCLRTIPIKDGNAEMDYRQPRMEYRQPQGLSPDGEVCALQWGTLGVDCHLAMMDCRSGNIIARLPFSLVEDVCFSPDSRTLVLWKDGEMRCFDARTAKPLWQTTGQFLSLAMEPRFTPDGCIGVARLGGFDFLDARTGKMRRHLRTPALAQMESWNFSPDGKQLWWSNPKHQVFYRDLE